MRGKALDCPLSTHSLQMHHRRRCGCTADLHFECSLGSGRSSCCQIEEGRTREMTYRVLGNERARKERVCVCV